MLAIGIVEPTNEQHSLRRRSGHRTSPAFIHLLTQQLFGDPFIISRRLAQLRTESFIISRHLRSLR
jgi:hypothetical protein